MKTWGPIITALLVAGCNMPAVPNARTSALAPIRVVGRHDVMEVGPVLYAARSSGADFASGGVDNLFKDGRTDVGRRGEFGHAAGGADVAAQAETQALRASVDHPDLRIIMTVAEGLYEVVARRSAGITTAADLRGKRIGVFERTSAAYFLHTVLANAGMTESDIVVVPLRPREMAPALANRKVDAVVIWEPESERSRAILGSDAIGIKGNSRYRELYNLNVPAAALADPARRAQLLRFVRHVMAASRLAATKPEAIWTIVSESSGYAPELVAASWRHHRFPAAMPPDMLDILVEEEEWLANQAQRTVRSRSELAKLIDRSLLDEAINGADPVEGSRR